MACNQAQLKKWEWPVEEAAALFRKARTGFLNKGVTDFNEIVDGLSGHYNLKREIIIKGLASPKGVSNKLTNEMWAKQAAARRVANTAKAAVREWDTNKFLKGLDFVANAPRRVLLAGHFGAFTKSHLPDQLFYNPKTYWDNFRNSWGLATKGGIAKHEQRVMTELDPTDPKVKLALRSGLNVGEGGFGAFTKETKEMTGIKKLFHGPDRASMAYDELRMSRMKIFRKEEARLSESERADLDQVKALSGVINHDTGTTAMSNRLARFLFLSPRLLPAQLTHTFVDIPKALFHTGMGFNYANAAPAMRYVARKTAILAGAYTAGLAANVGVGLATQDKRFMPNLGQEGAGKGSFLRPKLFGRSIPVSPTIELMKLPVQMIAAGAAARKGDNRTVVALTRGMKTIIGRQNPLFSIIEEGISGQETATGRPMPFPGLMGAAPETKHQKRIGYVEYAGSKLPIPVANYMHEFFDEATSHGMPPQTALEWMKMLVAPTIELGTSYHLSPDYSQAPEATASRRSLTSRASEVRRGR